MDEEDRMVRAQLRAADWQDNDMVKVMEVEILARLRLLEVVYG
jgi:hypothetical protein